MVSTRVDEEERLLPSVVAVGLMSTPHTLVEDKEEKDVPVEVREHVGELGRHYRALSKRHVFCLSLLAAALIFLENDDVSLLLKKACLALFISSYADYFIKPSPLLDDVTVRLHVDDLIRPISDKLVWSSCVYGIAGVYSLYLGQYAFGTLQIVTCAGSSLYHLRKEAVFFNFDNTFASSLLFLTLYAGCMAIHVQDWTHCFATVVGLPIAVFLIVFCGMPASLAREHKHGPGFRQCAGRQYDDWHTAWHLVSGAGTVVTAHFFQKHWPGLQCGGSNFGVLPHLPVVPTACVAFALSLNIVGNWAGVMPVC
ncbi:hypothetical protein NSK_007379 [Nannochloropsis salina CCMP1776]|uniref:Uncharacterized protein n=1 Tax=Nannochloropsis salina CCMP1776 TaxID=1027361 RepID=A0A4D9CY89_9STRA|nr:hypothetical protein NSK_007379 [Nannochloropsis salina CCMP1776]|eukprot:TFJ81418.1 hypothetical protein NSK_007379 [Nannochloropsis salina CCMP1776]